MCVCFFQFVFSVLRGTDFEKLFGNGEQSQVRNIIITSIGDPDPWDSTPLIHFLGFPGVRSGRLGSRFASCRSRHGLFCCIPVPENLHQLGRRTRNQESQTCCTCEQGAHTHTHTHTQREREREREGSCARTRSVLSTVLMRKEPRIIMSSTSVRVVKIRARFPPTISSCVTSASCPV